jgi:hypothetical protein
MAVHSHTARRFTGHDASLVGRPPYRCVETRACEMRIAMPGVAEPRQCGNRSLWLLPELARCGSHVPDDLVALLQQRVRLWEELATESWLHVVDTLPLPAVR